MKTNLIKADQIHASNWSQGKTSEYYIYPTTANYQDHDFIFRISSATIDNSPAIFTKFDNYSRYLVMLSNEIELSINNNNQTYSQYEVIKFQSNDDVISKATGKDFNLMVTNNIKETDVYLMDNIFDFTSSIVFIFALTPMNISLSNTNYFLEEYDCLIIENESNQTINIELSQKAIVGTINF